MIFVLAGEVSTVEHVLSKTPGGSLLCRLSSLADRDMLGKQCWPLFVDEYLHIDENLSEVGTRSREGIDPLIDTHGSKPLLEFLKRCQRYC